MRVLVTGAGGFTGEHVIAELRRLGDEPHILDADLRDPPAIVRQVAALRPDATIHLAARAFVASGDVDDFYTINQIGTFHLLDALANHASGTPVLLASSAQVYAADQSGLLDENTLTKPSNHYGLSKLAMEMGAQFWRESLQLTITRPFNYTGKGQKNCYLIPKILDHFIKRVPIIELGNIDIERDFGDVRDVAKSYVALIHAEKTTGTFNVSTGKLSSISDVIDHLTDMTGHKIEVRVNPHFIRANDIRSLGGDNRRLRAALPGWTPRPLIDTLTWMLTGDR